MNDPIEFPPLVDMDGELTEQERKRIIKRLHAVLSWVGSQIPDREEIWGKHVNPKEIVLDLVSKKELTRKDIETAANLARALEVRELDLEREIIKGDISEEEALLLLEEARGLLRAIMELKDIRDAKAKDRSKDLLLAMIDDEKRWLRFRHKLKK